MFGKLVKRVTVRRKKKRSQWLTEEETVRSHSTVKISIICLFTVIQ